MAVKFIGGSIKKYLGTNAERIAMDVTGLPDGCLFFTTDTKATYILAGGTWVQYPDITTIVADLATLLAAVGDPSAHTLTSLVAKLGDNAQTFNAMIGYQGASSLADKLTAARAALLDQITALRMAELDAANIPADIDTLLTRLSAARAGYLDNINQAGLLQVTAARAALLDQITAARMAELDAANIPADVDTLKTNVGSAAGQTLTSIVAKIGDIARSIDVILGNRWDSSGDLGSDIADLIEETTKFDIHKVAYVDTTTTKNASVTLFDLDALGKGKKNIEITLKLDADAAATFTPSWWLTSPDAPTTFVQELVPAIAAIATPAANGRYRYSLGPIPEGLQAQFRIAQDNNGAATVPVRGEINYDE